MNKSLRVLALSSLTVVACMNAEEKKRSAQGKGLDILYVDTFEIMRNCELGQKVTKEIETERDRYAKELKDEEALVVKAMTDFQTSMANASKLNNPAIKEEVRTAKLEEEEKRINNMRRQLQARAQELEETLKASMQKASERVAKVVEDGVREAAIAGNYDAAMDTTTGRAIWVKAELNQTKMVTELVDSKSKKAAAPAATPSRVTQSTVPAKQKTA